MTNIAVIPSCRVATHTLHAGSGKTCLLEGRAGLALDDDSVNSHDEGGLVQQLAASLFEMLEEKQVATGLVCVQVMLIPLFVCTKRHLRPTDHHHQDLMLI